MKVKITGCSDKALWYKDKIGQEFEIDESYHEKAEDFNKRTYGIYVTWVNGKEHGIKFEDCQLVGVDKLLKPLRCGCPNHSDVVAKYNETSVEIKCKHGQTKRLTVVKGKLEEDKRG